MPTLLDKIKQNLEASGNPQTTRPAVSTLSQTEKANTLVAGRSGKAAALAPRVLDQSAEMVAKDETADQLGQVQQAGQLAGAQLSAGAAQAEQEYKSKATDVEQRRQAIVQGNQIRKQQLIASLSQDKESARFSDDKSRQEQIAQLLRLEDKKYVDKLELEGAKQRLDTDLGFRTAMEKARFGDTLDILRDKLDTNSILAANDRQYTSALAKISLDDAMQIANLQSSATRAKNQQEDTNSLAKTGIQGYGDYKKGEYSEEYQNDKQDNGYKGSYSKWQSEQGE